MQITEKVKSNKFQTVWFKNLPVILAGYSVAGPKEGKGPLGNIFDRVLKSDYFDENTHEKAERKMFETAIKGAIRKAGETEASIDMLMSGDLLNQIISSSFAARQLDLTYVGVYGACSTMALSLAQAACMVNAGYFSCVAAATGSHFATAERQYRYPLEFGNQKPPESQWTVTGSGCSIIANHGSGPRITCATFGKVTDFGIVSVDNMGAAMAPSACSTMIAHFKDTKTTPEHYDAIFTGDLGKLGSNILRDLLKNKGIELGQRYTDCGHLIFDKNQHAYQGGSGCGCSALVFNSLILNRINAGESKRVLFVATGALMSIITAQQGETIPCISHAVVIEADKQ